MIDDPAGRLSLFKYLRSIPLSPSERDLITGLASEISALPSFPRVDEIALVFGNIPQLQLRILEAISICSNAACDLTITLVSHALNTHRSDQIKTGVQIYVTEMMRLSGSLFPLQHDFWKTFYQYSAPMRLTTWTDSALDSNADAAVAHALTKSKFGLFLLPLDAMYILSGEANQLTYEMLRHSLIAAFSALLLFAVHADPVTISAQLALASKLSARLDLRAYDEWQALIFHQLLSKKLS